jgi:hypothetical protein
MNRESLIQATDKLINVLTDLKSHNSLNTFTDKELFTLLSYEIMLFDIELKRLEKAKGCLLTENELKELEEHKKETFVLKNKKITISYSDKKEEPETNIPTEDFDIKKFVKYSDWVYIKAQEKCKEYKERVNKVFIEKADNNPYLLHELIEKDLNVINYLKGNVETLV